MINGSNPNYIPIEYPKWVDGVLVQNAAEEKAHRAAMAYAEAAARSAEIARPPSPAGVRMRRTWERGREGRMSIRCDVSTDQIKALSKAGLIDPATLDDAAKGLGGFVTLSII
jgi:hypothetical protein